MAKVDWINGKIAPPESGEYYVILEAQQDIRDRGTNELLVSSGDVEMIGDWYDADGGYFDSIGENNPFWRVLSWADILKPDVPDDIKPKLRSYFSEKVKWEDGKWKNGT
jgi:hypothetical protein|nr:MAG TPA_asm: hypothetical protein [Caudoviricetes sp.]